MGFFKLGKMTLKSLVTKADTIQYPAQTKTPPEGLKGTVLNDTSLCILCGICQKRCPADAIEVDKASRSWSIDRFRCVQCASCIRECPKHCLSMDPAWPAPATSKSVERFEVPERPKPERAKAKNAVQAES